MKWVYPEFLFALLVVLIPLLIHLFHFRKYKTVFFSSLIFVKSIEKEQSNVRKLKQWIIFALRALAFIFIVLAFAQPYFPASNAASEKDRTVIGIYIDNSFSMSRIGSKGECLIQAKELAKQIVNDAPRNTQFVLFTNELGGEEKQALSKSDCIEKIDKISYSPLFRGSETVLSWWNEWCVEQDLEQSVSGRQLVWLSDFQKVSFAQLKKKSATDLGLVTPVMIQPVKPGNLTIDSVWFESPVHKIGAKQTIYARLHNYSSENIEAMEVNFRLGGINRDVFTNLAPFSSDTVALSFYHQNDGFLQGTATINDKQMLVDDAFYFTVNVRKNGNVLIADGEEAVPNVAKVYGLDDYYNYQSSPLGQISNGQLKTMDLVVINGANNLPSNVGKLLIDFVGLGGTVLCLPGSNPTPSGWNNFLSAVGLPSLSGQQESGLTLKKINVQDRFFEGVFERKPNQIHLPLVKKALRFSSNSGTSIALIEHQNGTPFFLKTTNGKQVFISSTPLNSEASSFTSNQLFSTILLRVGELSQRQLPLFLTIGDNARFPLSDLSTAEAALKLTNKRNTFLPKVAVINEQAFLQVNGLETVRSLLADNYNIEKSGKTLGALSVNYNRSESDVIGYSIDEISKRFKDAGITISEVKNGSDNNGSGMLQLDKAQTYWRWCLIGAICFIFLEMIVVIFFKK